MGNNMIQNRNIPCHSHIVLNCVVKKTKMTWRIKEDPWRAAFFVSFVLIFDVQSVFKLLEW